MRIDSSHRIGLRTTDAVLSRGDRRYRCCATRDSEESRVRIIPYTPRIQWARVAKILLCGAHARRNLTAAHRRAQDDRVLPLMGLITSTWRAQVEHLRFWQSPQRCLAAALGIGEEHVGSLAWLCRVLQASGRFSALRRSLQVIYRKAHHGCAINTSINAVNGLSEIQCLSSTLFCWKVEWAWPRCQVHPQPWKRPHTRASSWLFPSWMTTCSDSFHTLIPYTT